MINAWWMVPAVLATWWFRGRWNQTVIEFVVANLLVKVLKNLAVNNPARVRKLARNLAGQMKDVNRKPMKIYLVSRLFCVVGWLN